LPSRPERTCVGCRRKAPTSELVRVVRLSEHEVAVGRNLPGRGAWLCREDAGPSQRCINVALRRKAFDRAFRAPVADAAIHALRAPCTKRARMEGRHD